MKQIIFIVYVVLGVFDAHQADIHGNRVCKPFLMPLLAMFYLLAGGRNTAVLLGIGFDWLGDVCLLKHKKSWLFAGIMFFLAGHLCYCSVLFAGAKAQYPLICVMYVCTAVGSAAKTTTGVPWRYRWVLFVYAIVLCMMSYGAFLRMCAGLSYVTFFAWIGSLLFLVSDTLIGFEKFKRRKVKGIMWTYLTAQYLLTAGFLGMFL